MRALTLLVLLVAAAPAFSQCPAPSNLAASQGTNCSGVQVGWGAVGHAASYNLARNISPTLTGAVVLTGITATSYLDTNAQPDRPYYYWVQAAGGLCGNASPLAGPVSGFVRPASGDMTTFGASRGSACGGILISWGAADNASGYDLWRGASNNLNAAEYLGPTTQTSYFDATIPAINTPGGHPWYYWARAHAPCGNSPTIGPSEGFWSSISGLPDLRFVPGSLENASVHFSAQTGYQLRFSTEVGNAGTDPLFLFYANGQVPEQIYDVFQAICQPGNPAHLVGTVRLVPFDMNPPLLTYRLREEGPGQSLGAVVAEGSLGPSCMSDVDHFSPGLPGSPAGPVYNCSIIQDGLSVGWAALYGSTFPGQSLDLACAHNGPYWLEAQINASGAILESDITNNFLRREVTVFGLPPNHGLTFISQPASRAACVGGIATLTVGVAGEPPSFAWYKGPAPLVDGPTGHGSTIQGAATPSLSVIGATGADAGVYSCVVSAGSCIRSSDAASLTINSADFDGDGDLGTDADIGAFFACLAGSCCEACGSADFNGDGDAATDADIEAFFRVLAGGSC